LFFLTGTEHNDHKNQNGGRQSGNREFAIAKCATPARSARRKTSEGHTGILEFALETGFCEKTIKVNLEKSEEGRQPKGGSSMSPKVVDFPGR